MIVLNGRIPIKAWVDGVQLEEEAKKQLYNMAALPFVSPHIAVMPDVHWGMGATVGSVIPTDGAIIPAAVGVDIGCGMMAKKLPIDINAFKDLSKLRHSIERSIPLGMNSHKEPVLVKVLAEGLKTTRPIYLQDHPNVFEKSLCQIGTLGGGNHFIELCHDENNQAWVVLHSGSRNAGKTLATYYIEKAKGICKQYFISLPDPDLAYLAEATEDFNNYITALLWAQNYAKINRRMMMQLILKDINYHLGYEKYDYHLWQSIDCHHNFTRRENHFGKNLWITRKGAVGAHEGQLGIIPGSMGAKSYIVKGKGNLNSFCSCSHGAGRAMSRNQAKKIYSIEDHIKATEGVECLKDESVLDETPMAYKDIDAVMSAQSDLVEVVHTLKQVLCVKG